MTSPRGALPIASSKFPAPSRLVLASESPRRKELLQHIGIMPDAITPAQIDESPRKREMPRAYALRMARGKANAVSLISIEEPALVLAADTVVACGRRILPKAESDVQVRDCLALLGGRTHQVLTAVALVTPQGRMHTRIVVTRVCFARPTSEAIEAYVKSGEGLGKAGGYAIQGKAEAFVRHINGSYSNVVGLPLFETVNLLKGCGYSVRC